MSSFPHRRARSAVLTQVVVKSEVATTPGRAWRKNMSGFSSSPMPTIFDGYAEPVESLTSVFREFASRGLKSDSACGHGLNNFWCCTAGVAQRHPRAGAHEVPGRERSQDSFCASGLSRTHCNADQLPCGSQGLTHRQLAAAPCSVDELDRYLDHLSALVAESHQNLLEDRIALAF